MSGQYRTFNSYQVRSAIMARTDGLKNIKSPELTSQDGRKIIIGRESYIKTLLYKVRNAKKIYYGTVEAPNEIEINKKVIGKGGCYFYKTTIEKKILFMWHNREKGVYEFWSESVDGLENAMNAIEDRKVLCSNHINILVVNSVIEQE
jgi:hypothetical protein